MQKEKRNIKNQQGIIPELVSGSSTHVVTQQQKQAWKALKKFQGLTNFKPQHPNIGQALPDNQTKCYSKLDLESHHTLLSNNELLNQVQDDRKRGFTLIELLVVVLIIGILAAVALPQYQLAVEKSRAFSIIPIMRAIYEAQQVYYLANGTYATSFAELDVEPPAGTALDGNKQAYTYPNHQKILLFTADTTPSVQFYPNTAHGYWLEWYYKTGVLTCWAGKTNDRGNTLCKAISGRDAPIGGSTNSYTYHVIELKKR